MSPSRGGYRAETLAMRLIAYSGSVFPNTSTHTVVLAERDCIDTAIEFAISARRFIQAEGISEDNASFVQARVRRKLSYPEETSLVRALHGIIHSTWMFADTEEVDHSVFSESPAWRLNGLCYETDRYPRKSVCLERLGLSYLRLRHPNKAEWPLQFAEEIPRARDQRTPFWSRLFPPKRLERDANNVSTKRDVIRTDSAGV